MRQTARSRRSRFSALIFVALVSDASAGVVLSGDANFSSDGAFTSLSMGNMDGQTGTAVVTAPAVLNLTGVFIGAGQFGQGTGSMTVSGVGASVVASNIIGVGTTGNGSLLIKNGGSVTSQGGQSQFCPTGCNFAIVGNGGGSHGRLTVDGAGSFFQTLDSLNNNAGFIVANGHVTGPFGQLGVPTSGTMNVINGATASTTFARIAAVADSDGYVQVRGPGSNWTVNRTINVNASVVLGVEGRAALDVTSGGSVNAQQMVIGAGTGSDGNLYLSGIGSRVVLAGQDIAGPGGARMSIGVGGSGRVQVADGAELKIDAGAGRGGITIGNAQAGGDGVLNVFNTSKVLLSGTDNTLRVSQGRVNIAQNSVVDVAHGTGSFGTTMVGANVAGSTAAIDIHQSTLHAGNFLGIAYGSAPTAGAGRVLLQANATVNADNIVIGNNGLFGGHGTVNGNVLNLGGVVQVGASPDMLIMKGNYVQSGGEIRFEVDPDGQGGFLFSTLTLDETKIIDIDRASIIFQFVGGADAQAFINAGLFNVNTFFKMAGGTAFSDLYDVATMFERNAFILAGFAVEGIDPVTGGLLAVSAVPEPASLWLIAVAGLACAVVRRRLAPI